MTSIPPDAPASDGSVAAMRAAVVDASGSISTTSMPVPVCGPGEVRVRVDACGLCGSDLHAYRSKGWQRGLIPGHEIAGRIDRLGSSEERGGDGQPLEVGVPVVVEPIESCTTCAACLAGRDSICPDLAIAGVHRSGGFAEFIVVPANRVYAFEPDLEPIVATLVEPFAVALHGLERVSFTPGQRVLVLGGGTIGQLCAFAARISGAEEVTIRTRYPHQHALAEALCPGAARDASEDLREAGLASHFDIVIETVGGASQTLIEACRAARPGGRIVVLGLFDRDPPFNPLVALQKELELYWSNCYQTGPREEADFVRAARAVAEHRDTLRQLITHRESLDTIERAFALASDKRSGVGKLAVLIGETEKDASRS